jgi:hypothetical protein
MQHKFRIGRRVVLVGAGMLCVASVQTAFAKPAVKEARPTLLSEKPSSLITSDEAAQFARARTQADKQQKSWDANAAVAAKSICSNC